MALVEVGELTTFPRTPLSSGEGRGETLSVDHPLGPCEGSIIAPSALKVDEPP